MGNPAAAAITHVLHNKQEFPLATSVDDLLVLSIGTGAASSSSSAGAGWNTPMPTRSPSPRELARVAAEGVADMVDESVAMAFGHTSGSNYVRIQASKTATTALHADTAAAAGAMLSQRNVESVLFRGRRMSERTNAEKVDAVAAELVKEHERRRRSPLPNVVIKQVGTPRLSSATTASSATTTRTASTLASPASYGSRQ
uniref:PNPLA domain-containing protein n=2 Tax=Oryza brachyantha TaxID=4533 RepID=J3LR22_ORYBR